MEKLISYFFFDYRLKFQSIWFKRLLYVYLILRSALWLFHYDLLFGKHSLVVSTPQSIGAIKDLAFILYSHSEIYLSLAALILVLLLSGLNLFMAKAYIVADLFIWLLVLNIHNKIYPSLTGGDLLLNQFMFFNCFICNSFFKKDTWQNTIKVCLHNTAVVAVIIQLCLVYFLSGLAKAGDAEWVSGKALIFISQIQHFSLYSSLKYDPRLDLFYISLNYLVLFYQLFFPILIWIRKIKKPLLIAGILMHLYIGLVMGLPEFSAIMIIAYVYFWPVKHSIT